MAAVMLQERVSGEIPAALSLQAHDLVLQDTYQNDLEHDKLTKPRFRLNYLSFILPPGAMCTVAYSEDRAARNAWSGGQSASKSAISRMIGQLISDAFDIGW